MATKTAAAFLKPLYTMAEGVLRVFLQGIQREFHDIQLAMRQVWPV